METSQVDHTLPVFRRNISIKAHQPFAVEQPRILQLKTSPDGFNAGRIFLVRTTYSTPPFDFSSKLSQATELLLHQGEFRQVPGSDLMFVDLAGGPRCEAINGPCDPARTEPARRQARLYAPRVSGPHGPAHHRGTSCIHKNIHACMHTYVTKHPHIPAHRRGTSFTH